MMKANKKVMAALLAAMMTVSAGAAVVNAGVPVDGIGSVGSAASETGWQYTKGANGKGYWSYAVSKNEYAKGWKLIDGAWYYFAWHNDNWEPDMSHALTGECFALVDTKTGVPCADGNWYDFRFDKDGKMVTGWYKTSNAKDPIWGDAQNWEYYSPSTGAQQKGWIKVGANWFYMTDTQTIVEYKENGQWLRKTMPANTLMMNGTYKFLHGSEAGKTYTFAANGVLVNEGQGWVKEGSDWYYVQEDGTRFKGGWVLNDNVGTRYTSSSWKLINGKYYLFNADGKMLTGWNRAYTDSSNKTLKWYYCTANGDCVMNNWVQMSNGDWYLTNASGEMVTGWAVRGGKTYFLNDGSFSGNLGVMATGTVKLGNNTYTFDANGALVALNGQTVNPGVIPQ